MTKAHFVPEITEDFVRLHEKYFVPAIYAQWANRVVEIAEIDAGNKVLDVSCRTGVLARAAGLQTRRCDHFGNLVTIESLTGVYGTGQLDPEIPG